MIVIIIPQITRKLLNEKVSRKYHFLCHNEMINPANIPLDQDVLKTSSKDKDERRLQPVFKASTSRRVFAGLIISLWQRNDTYLILFHLVVFSLFVLLFLLSFSICFLMNFYQKLKTLIFNTNVLNS